MNDWIEEIQEDAYGMKWRVTARLFKGKSEFQDVEIIETKSHGRMLLNDGLVMVTERDEHVYHEMIAHVPLFTHMKPRKVLVIGGGDGGTVREVLKHSSVERCDLVEIDGMVVEASRKFLPQTASQLSDPRVRVLIEDGVKFMKESREVYDVILVDSTDPIGPAAPLFNIDFYKDVSARLSETGIVVAQGECAFYHLETQKSLVGIFDQVFAKTYMYNYSNLTYPGGMWSFILGTKKFCPVRDFDPARVTSANLSFQYYNRLVHRGAFMLPQFMIEGFPGLENHNVLV